MVIVLRLLLPTAAAGLIAVVTLWSQFGIEENRFRLGVAQMAPRQVDSLTMVNPRFEGVDGKHRPFNVTADTARQADKTGDIIDLIQPKADITLESGAWLALTAAAGRYRRQDNLLDLSGGVSIFHDKGFTFQTPTLHVDMASKAAETSDPVQGQGPSGDVTGRNFRMTDGGTRVLFGGPAHVTLIGDAVQQTKPAVSGQDVPAAAGAIDPRR
jgi:lipopolysaccharide export system protein LptC